MGVKMELLIMFLIIYIIVSIQEWIAEKRLNRVKSLLGMPTEEAEKLGPGSKVSVFGPPKTGIVTGTVGYEQLEEMGANLDGAEKLIKEAKEKKID
jgi:hypothetical protein